jgi:hypothetical protein
MHESRTSPELASLSYDASSGEFPAARLCFDGAPWWALYDKMFI